MNKMKWAVLVIAVLQLAGCFSASVILPGGGRATVGSMSEGGVEYGS